MDFDFAEEQQILLDSVRRFARQELAPGAVARAAAEAYPWDVAGRMAELGLMGLSLPTGIGGAGGSLLDAIIAIQAVAEFCPRSADVVQAGNFGPMRTFAEYASPEQRERWLSDLLKGRLVISLGMTEPGAGSAVTELATTARGDGDAYVIDGRKIFGTHSADAGLFLIYVRFGPGLDGIGSVLVERDTPGFEIGQPSRFMNGEHWSPLYFDGCRIPAGNVLLGPGGFRRQMAGFNIERLGNAARAVALGRHAFALARDHALTRHQFGKPLAHFQGLQWKFADMEMRLESAQLLLLRAAARARDGLPDAHDAALAKLACNEAGYFAANEALQVMGALGFSEECLAQYCLRRTRGWMIAGGSVEILRNRIAEGVFGQRFSQRAGAPK